MSYAPFRASGPTLAFSATTSSLNSAWAPGVAGNSPVVRIVNLGPNAAFVRTGKGAQTAAGTDVPIAPGATSTLLKGGDDNIAVVCPSGTAAVYATPGYGDY